jgi:hypothetical protein
VPRNGTLPTGATDGRVLRQPFESTDDPLKRKLAK